MKKLLSFILTFILLASYVIPVSISAVGTTTISVDSGEGSTTIDGYAGKVAKVYIKINDAKPTAGAKITVNYDEKLELAYAENGKDGKSAYLSDMSQSAIYGADVGAENGVYVFVASHNMSNSATTTETAGYLVTLSFKVPSDAKVGDEYEINISESLSELGSDNGNIDFNVVNGKIVVKEDKTSCTSHNYVETIVSKATYMTPGFSYKECSLCHDIQIEKTSEWQIGAIGYEGIAIRYAGNPTGIAATFTFNEKKIKDIELDSKYQVEVGTIAFYGDEGVETIYYKDGSSTDVKNGKIFAILTGISSKEKVKFAAYVTIIDTESGTKRTEYFKATLGDSEEVCIYDIVTRMNLKSYPSDASQKYLNTVLNGF